MNDVTSAAVRHSGPSAFFEDVNHEGEKIVKSCMFAVSKTYVYAQQKLIQIAAYAIAWGVIFAISGTLYGFKAVSIPLTIGLGCGLGVGGVAGFLTCIILDPKYSRLGKNTPWDLINQGLDKLDTNTRQIVRNISITVIIAASVIYPIPMGVIFGILVSYQAMTRIFWFNKDDAKKELNQSELRA